MIVESECLFQHRVNVWTLWRPLTVWKWYLLPLHLNFFQTMGLHYPSSFNNTLFLTRFSSFYYMFFFLLAIYRRFDLSETGWGCGCVVGHRCIINKKPLIVPVGINNLLQLKQNCPITIQQEACTYLLGYVQVVVLKKKLLVLNSIEHFHSVG